MLVLYSSGGNGQLFHVCAESMGRGECHLRLKPLQVTSVKAATLPDGRAKALVTSDFTRAVHVSSEFERLYGYSLAEIKGRTLSCIHGPATDTLQWRTILDGACNGWRQSALLVTSTRDCREVLTSVLAEPVVDCGAIAFIAITFTEVGDMEGRFVRGGPCHGEWGPDPVFDDVVVHSLDPATDYNFIPAARDLVVRGELYELALLQPEAEPLTSNTSPANPATLASSSDLQDTPVRQRYFEATGAHKHALPRTVSESTQCSMSSTIGASTDQDACGDGGAELPPEEEGEGGDALSGAGEREQDEVQKGAGVEGSEGYIVVVPRFKSRQDRRETTQHPVVLSLDLLQRLMSMPLCAAAETLGLSSTAMKKACRRLGVQRWPYNVHTARGARARGPEQFVSIDAAYVRRIQRKYTLMERRVAQGLQGPVGDGPG